MSRQQRFPIAWASVLALSTACAGILGIEEAVCDPTYSSDCLGGPQTGGAGGSSGIQTQVAANQGGSSSTGSAGSGTVGSMGASGPAAGTGGSLGNAGAGGSSMAAAGNAGTAAVDVDPIAARATPLCREYCATVAENCTGPNQQYASATACLAVCELLEPGTPGDTSANTVECRLGRAELAASTGEPGNYCYSAGPGGADVCGTDCEGFCAVMSQTCDEMGTLNQCLAACSIVPDLSLPPTNRRYSTVEQAGDSLQCRLFHVSAASVDPVGHCVHAAGLAVCN